MYHLKSGINKIAELYSYHQYRNIPPEKWYIISSPYFSLLIRSVFSVMPSSLAACAILPPAWPMATVIFAFDTDL